MATKDAKKKRTDLTTSGRPDVVSVADLDRAVEAIREIAADTAAAYHSVGVHLADVRERQLWKLRTLDGGKPAFRSFEQWAFRELGISPGNAASMIAVASRFTAEDVRAFGRSKLELVTRLPRDMHEGILREIAHGESYRSLRRKVQTHKAATGYVRGDDDTTKPKPRTLAATKARAALAAPPTGEERVTVAFTRRKHVVPLHVRGDDSSIPIANRPRARSLDDCPIGGVDLANGVRLWIFVGPNKRGDLAASLVLQRHVPHDDGETNEPPEAMRRTA